MLTLIKLEFWKQSKTFLSTLLALVFGIMIPALLLPLTTSLRLIESFSGAASLMILLMPLVIVFLASSAAASLRKTEDKNHEELLPVHPILRIYGAYLINLFFTAFIFVVVFSLLGVREVFYIAAYRLELFELPFGMIVLYAWTLHCLSFSISYVLNLPVLGAGLALIFSTVDLFFRGLFLYYIHYWSSEPIELFHLTFLIPTIFVFFTPTLAAFKLERGLKFGIKGAFPVVLCFLVLPFWIFLMGYSMSNTFWMHFWVTLAETL
ncbi:hypothetical protein L0222_27790 [bacterium]|nr:hypothetical protein [bacterium]MCI0602018.1 hypothetical protein [bacterium]